MQVGVSVCLLGLQRLSAAGLVRSADCTKCDLQLGILDVGDDVRGAPVGNIYLLHIGKLRQRISIVVGMFLWVAHTENMPC